MSIAHLQFSLLVLMIILVTDRVVAQENEPSNSDSPRYSIVGNIEQSISTDWNFDLNEDKEDGVMDSEIAAEVAISMDFSTDVTGNLSLKANREVELEYESRERHYKSSLELDEAFIQFDDMFDIEDVISKSALTLGRFNLKDNRKWFYDKNLDGLLVSLKLKPIKTNLNLSVNREELIGSDLLQSNKFDRVNNFIIAAEHEPLKDVDIEIGAYAIVRDDRSSEGENSRLYGFSSKGRLLDKRINYWTNFAWATGTDKDKRTEGYGYDLGATISSHRSFRSYLTLGYAYGSGKGDTDSDFRKTDLHGSSDKFGGVASFKYYGELLDPELVNLHIYTAGIGLRFSKTASIDFVLHHYRQDVALDELRSTDLDLDPDGVDTQLGNELDVILGFNLESNIKSEIVLAYFQPGSAFDKDSDDAAKVEAKFSFNF